jgi:anthranilate synthase component 2
MTPRVFLLDNYDSFTYNLVQLLARIGAEVTVARNDEVSVAEVRDLDPDAVVISPGPSRPERAGISVELVRELGPTVPLLGVCLGHQAIGEAFGGETVGAGEIVHGKTSMITHDGKGVFRGLANPFEAIRYHSLAIGKESFPEDELEVTATSDSGVIMGVRHRRHAVEGVQFHPESILTGEGKHLLKNFLEM